MMLPIGMFGCNWHVSMSVTMINLFAVFHFHVGLLPSQQQWHMKMKVLQGFFCKKCNDLHCDYYWMGSIAILIHIHIHIHMCGTYFQLYAVLLDNSAKQMHTKTIRFVHLQRRGSCLRKVSDLKIAQPWFLVGLTVPPMLMVSQFLFSIASHRFHVQKNASQSFTPFFHQETSK